MRDSQQPARVSRAQIQEFHASRPSRRYRKKGTFLARPAEPGETILTFVAGKLETLAVASWGHVVLMNIEIGSSVERYLVEPGMFEKRYERTERTIVTDGHSWMMVRAKGLVDAFRYEGPDIVFEAPWGEDMLMQEGDRLARAVGGKPDDIYRIERAAFEQTYSEEVAAEHAVAG